MESGRDLDIIIGEKIFNYEIDREFDEPCVSALRDRYDEWGILPHYSTDMNDAWLVIEAVQNTKKLRVSIGQEWNGSWMVVFGTGFQRNTDKQADADTPALAICLAALKAIDYVPA